MDNFSERYAECLPYLVDKASVYFRLHGSSVLHRLGSDLTIDQFIALDAIALSSDICQRDLAKILLKDRSNVTRIVSILEKKSLIKRISTTKSKRPVKMIKITEKGQKVVDELSPVLKGDLKDFTSSFSANDLEQFVDTLNKIISKISENENIQI